MLNNGTCVTSFYFYHMLYFLIRDKYDYVEVTKNVSLMLCHMGLFAISGNFFFLFFSLF